MPCFARVSGNFMKFKCQLGKLLQTFASCDYLLVVKLVVKRLCLTTKHFFIFPDIFSNIASIRALFQTLT